MLADSGSAFICSPTAQYVWIGTMMEYMMVPAANARRSFLKFFSSLIPLNAKRGNRSSGILISNSLIALWIFSVHSNDMTIHRNSASIKYSGMLFLFGVSNLTLFQFSIISINHALSHATIVMVIRLLCAKQKHAAKAQNNVNFCEYVCIFSILYFFTNLLITGMDLSGRSRLMMRARKPASMTVQRA